MYFIPIILIHVGLVLLYLGILSKRRRRLDSIEKIFLFVFPIVGVLIVEHWPRQNKVASERFDDMIPWLDEEEESHREKALDLDLKHILPFQEALLMNNPSIKRDLIINVIFEAPDQFIPLLHQARLNDDVEVVHYATTILSEITNQYDSKLQKLERRLRRASTPEKVAKRREDYHSFLKQYIESGIAEGYFGQTLKRKFVMSIQEVIHQGQVPKKEYLFMLADLYIESKNVLELTKLRHYLHQHFPSDEDVWMLDLKAILNHTSEQTVKDFLQNIEKEKITFSRKNREILNFLQ